MGSLTEDPSLRMELDSQEMTLSGDPERASLLQTRELQGRRYWCQAGERAGEDPSGSRHVSL